MDRMRGARMDRPDAALIVDEFANNARMAVTGCRMGRLIVSKKLEQQSRSLIAPDIDVIRTEHRRLWLARNRPGGLTDSLRVFETRQADCR